MLPAFKTNYFSNPFPKVIPENMSNYYTDECTQMSANNYKNRPEELLSTYWGNHYDEKYLDSPRNNNKFGEFERKSNFFLPDFKEEGSRPIYANKFHYNPEGSFMISTPPNYKKPREMEIEQPSIERYNSMSLGFPKKNNNFSEYFNSARRDMPNVRQSQQRFPQHYQQNIREMCLADVFDYDDDYGRSAKGIEWQAMKINNNFNKRFNR